MINVNMNSNLQGVQGWDQLAGMVKTSETKAAGGADVRIENKQIVVTVSDGKATQSVSVSVPDLGTLDSAPDTAALQSVAAKIVALADTLVAAGAFNADGTGTYDMFGEGMSFTYTDNGTSIEFLYEDVDDPTVLEYTIDGDTLTMKDSFGSDVTYVKK